MLRNYLKIAWRNLLRRRFYSLLNIVGLAVGITFTLLIGSYIGRELQVNRSLRHAGQQCLVQSRWRPVNRGMDITALAPIGPALKAQYPALVANYYRFHGVSATVSKGDNHFRESIQIGDSTLLMMYGFRLLHGNPRTALTSPNALVITADKALKLFGRTDVLNQLLTVETPQAGIQAYTVTGVLAPLPPNSVSHLLRESNEVFMSLGSLPYFGADMRSWQNPYIVTYIELQPGVAPSALDKPLARLIATNTPADVQRNLTTYVTPLTDYYRQSNNGLAWKMIVTLAAIAGFILLMAVVNFVTISMGSSLSRLREIGVRKVLGSLRWQLTIQFLLEALTLTAVATVFSVGLYVLFRPIFSTVVGKSIPSLTDLPWIYGWGLAGLVVVVGSLAGSYPALVLAAYTSVDSLKGKEKSVQDGQVFRRVLVTAQFTMALVVFVSSVMVSRQITYFFTTDLGFDKATVLTISSLPRNWSPEGVTRMVAARDQLTRLPGIRSVSLSFEIPNGNVGNNAAVYRQGQDTTQAVNMKVLTTDEYFAQTYQIRLLGGQYFRAGTSQQDSSVVVLTQTAARILGYKSPGAAVGQLVRVQGSPRGFRIAGVINDFHFGSLHKAIEPMVIGHLQNVPIYRFFSIRLLPGNRRATIARIEQKWRELFPAAPFEYAFMDQTLQELYQTELQMKQAGYVATSLALLIVVLGVVGLVSLSVARRTKEVGIRKVLGASVANVMLLFLHEYAWIMLLANGLAWPLAYWLLRNWLADYAYHTSLSWLPFVQVGGALAVLTSLLVSLQVVKAALMNPVASLRND